MGDGGGIKSNVNGCYKLDEFGQQGVSHNLDEIVDVFIELGKNMRMSFWSE